ncbi:MAG: hypothetical protein F9K40_09920 [Kofleriaceae bacterium]|nr:MAG: hypothetical protein F9K40_09920 [Kofleriaceae bacterium]
MRTQLTVAAVLVGALTFASPPVAAAEPAWCKGASFDGEPDLRDLSSKDAERAVATFAHAACVPSPEASANRAEIEKSRAAWGKRLGMTDADWADVVAWVNANEGRNTRLTYSTKDLSQFTPLDHYKAIVDGFDRGGGNGAYVDPIYVADALDQGLSHVGRFAYIEACLKAETSVASSAPPAATWALCQGDIEAFDLAKFHEELRADGAHAGDGKMMLRFKAMDLKQRLDEHARRVQAAWKLDPVYKQMFDVAAAARGEWAAGLGKHTKLLELVRRMNSAWWSGSRKQYEGCEAATAAALEEAVGKLPATTWKKMKDERFDPFGGFAKTAGPVLVAVPEINLAAEAYVLCRPKTGTADFLAYNAQDTVGYRGPRTMAFSRMLTEKLTLDDLTEKIYWPETERPYRRSGGVVGSAGGVIAKTKVEGDVATVTLERFIVKRKECVQSHQTNRISRILPDGTIEYERVCDKTGIVEYDQTWGDFQIKAVYAPLLKKGVKFSAVQSPEGGPADLLVLWPNKKTEEPSWLVGAKVK